MSLSVCLSVYMSVCPRAYLWNRWTDLHEILAVARSSSGGVAILYVLPVLLMTSLFAVMGRMAMRGRLNLDLLPLAALRYRGGV